MVAVALALVLVGLYVTASCWRRLWKYAYDLVKMRRIAGPPQLPFVGNAHMLEYGGPEFYSQVLSYADMYKDLPLFRLWIGIYPLVVLHHHKAVEALLSSTKHIRKAAQYDFLHEWLGTGLLTSAGAKWHGRRKMLTPTFHFSILQDFCPVFNEQARVLVEVLEARLDDGDSAELDIFPFMARCALDIICETAMGSEVQAQREQNAEYVGAVCRMSELVMQRMKNPLYYIDALYRRSRLSHDAADCLRLVHNFTTSVIKDRRRELRSLTQAERDELLLAKKRRKRLTFLDLLLLGSESADAGGRLSDEDVREEVDTFMFEGHDTTAAAMTWCLFLLGHHPDILAEVHKEVDSVWEEGRLNDDGNVASETLSSLPLLDRCVKEALRLYPSVPYYAREVEEDVELGGATVTAGTSVLVLASQVHRDARVYPQPQEFRPDRFLPERVRERSPYSYVPFSAGPRNCIGAKFAKLEERIVLCWLLRHFTVASLQSEEEVAPSGELILRPGNGVRVRLRHRLR